MKKKTVRRIAAFAVSSVLGAAALAMFAGCTTLHPEITITYNFDGKDYDVNYVLSRNDAPKTVQHFLELADAGFYDGMVVHDFQSNVIHSGGYYYDAQQANNGGLVEVNYLEKVKALESEKKTTFTQSVWADAAREVPLYTVYGEFTANGVTNAKRENSLSKGALVMYYTEKENASGEVPDVYAKRADGGSKNDGDPYSKSAYKYNSATSLFYTCTGSGGDDASNYCVFGKAKNYSGQMEKGLLAAINKYTETLEAEDEFTEAIQYRLNQYDYFRPVREGDVKAEFKFPRDMRITIRVKVNKY